MTEEEEVFMLFEGLVQWSYAAITQMNRINEAGEELRERDVMMNAELRHLAILRRHTECHFFAAAAWKIFEYRERFERLRPNHGIDFRCISSFSRRDVKDVRDMREHVVEYFAGEGRVPARWTVETAEFIADASSIAGTKIGGRLDWIEFGRAAELLLEQLLRLPPPFPKRI
jgi:hypothetical protein